jgi:hypothetical protein
LSLDLYGDKIKIFTVQTDTALLTSQRCALNTARRFL